MILRLSTKRKINELVDGILNHLLSEEKSKQSMSIDELDSLSRLLTAIAEIEKAEAKRNTEKALRVAVSKARGRTEA